MLAEHYNVTKFAGTIRLPILHTASFLLKPTKLRIADLIASPPSMYFVVQDSTPIHFHLVDHPKMMVFQLEDGTKTRIYLEPSTLHPAEPHGRHIRECEPPIQGCQGYCQEYKWKVGCRDELQSEFPVKLYWMGPGQKVIFHTVSVPLTVLKLVGYYSNGIAPRELCVLVNLKCGRNLTFSDHVRLGVCDRI
jgi:hypothetical protein